MRPSLQQVAEGEIKLEMTPMIDCVFLLLIFFMCTLKFKTLEGKLSAHLPKDVGVNQMEAEPIEKVEITLNVLNEGTKLDPRGQGPWSGKKGSRYIFGKDRVIEYAVGPRKTRDLAELQNRLQQLHEGDAKRPATIDARPGTVVEDVIRVLDACMYAGFESVTFVGSYE